MAAKYRLIVFDWDGTIADSEARIVSSVASALAETGLPTRTSDEIRNIIGLGMRESMEALFPEISPTRYQGFIDAYRKQFQSRARTPVTLFPEVKGVLESLASRGYLLAVATGKSRRGLDRELRESGLHSLIHVSRCADEAPSKPHPQMLVDVLELASVAPGMALMVGDTTYDMQMARDAGVDRVAVSYGAHERSRLIEFDPLTVVESLNDLEEWLSQPAQAK